MANKKPTILLNAVLKEVCYAPYAVEPLSSYSMEDLRSGRLASCGSFCLQANGVELGVSQWVTPKRTRTYPYARVYNTLKKKPRITVIPFCKDEGFDGDRDFLQWDTVSLMSLLGVYVIVGVYVKAKKNTRPGQAHKNKITNQIFDYEHIVSQVEELLGKYQSDPLHWNIKQMMQLGDVAKKALKAYRVISASTGAQMHGEDSFRKRIEELKEDVGNFRETSRAGAQGAQRRELQTKQPKEETEGDKAAISMQNLIGGEYHLTLDEYARRGDTFFMIEKKHARRGDLPGALDLRDSFIKMALFSNIDKLKLGNKTLIPKAMVGLTAPKIIGFVHSKMSDTEINGFIDKNGFRAQSRKRLWEGVREARHNNFGLFVSKPKQPQTQDKILNEFI